MTNQNRIQAIDTMRGLTLILMLFVNDLHMPGVPAWLGHRAADFDGMGLADWVFPGFLFMVGMAIPFAIKNRITAGDSNGTVSRHILIRTASLLVIGLLMSNSRNVNGDLTGISKNIWSMLTYTGVFILWNNYREPFKSSVYLKILKALAVIVILVMVYIFRSGAPQHNSFSFRSWGILGTIGWGYLAASFTYFLFRENILKTSAFVVFFLVLNILSKLHLLDFLSPVRPVLGVLINGNAPFIVLSGLLCTLVLKRFSAERNKAFYIITTLGIISIAAGFLLRNWFIISKIQATPSWGLLCNGLSMLLFALLFMTTDIMKISAWADFLKPAGANSLTVYLVPDMFYYIIWQFNLPLLFYKESQLPLVVIAGSLVWALIMGALLPVLLEKINFRLKL